MNYEEIGSDFWSFQQNLWNYDIQMEEWKGDNKIQFINTVKSNIKWNDLSTNQLSNKGNIKMHDLEEILIGDRILSAPWFGGLTQNHQTYEFDDIKSPIILQKEFQSPTPWTHLKSELWKDKWINIENFNGAWPSNFIKNWIRDNINQSVYNHSTKNPFYSIEYSSTQNDLPFWGSKSKKTKNTQKEALLEDHKILTKRWEICIENDNNFFLTMEDVIKA